MYANLGPGQIAERDPPSPNGVDVLYSHEYVAERMRERNLYGYCGNSPTNATDPTGLQSIVYWHKHCMKLPTKKKRCECHCIYAPKEHKCRKICMDCWGGGKKPGTKELCMCTCLAAGTEEKKCEKVCKGLSPDEEKLCPDKE